MYNFKTMRLLILVHFMDTDRHVGNALQLMCIKIYHANKTSGINC